jgi:hypothetical protein
MEMRDYNYYPGNSVEKRRLAIELALMDNSLEDVMHQLKNIQDYHPNIKLDISELDDYLEDVLFLKDVLLVEKRHKNIEKSQKKISIDYNGFLKGKRIFFGTNKEKFRKIIKK